MAIHDLNELWDEIRNARVGMFTTRAGDGRLNSRPMTSLETDVDGILWFGLDDPQLVLIRFTVDNAEYWDVDTNRMVQIFKMLRAAMTHDANVQLGNHGNFSL